MNDNLLENYETFINQCSHKLIFKDETGIHNTGLCVLSKKPCIKSVLTGDCKALVKYLEDKILK